MFPSYRDRRKYSEVVTGNRNNQNQRKLGMEKEDKITPVLFTINVEEDPVKVKMLENAIIAENVETWNLSHIVSKISTLNIPISGMYSNSPNKILLSFKSEFDSKNALEETSVLWNIFDDLRVWFESEHLDERLVWLDCFGLHPKCWSIENIKKIGERWGPVVYIDQELNCIPCLTHARMLVRTKVQNKIEARIRISFEHGSRDVWIKECSPSGSPLDWAGRKMMDSCNDDDKSCPESLNEWVSDSLNVLCTKNDVVCKDAVVSGGERMEDPMIQLVDTNNSGAFVEDDWFDPMVCVEAVSRFVLPAVVGATATFEPTTNGVCEQNQIALGKRPRGRQKKAPCPQTSISNLQQIDEARETWNTAKLLGISSGDEDAVIREIRKSKRLLLLEGNTP
ncbi:unnamed protein product [Amaranthus hypochondriacus]